MGPKANFKNDRFKKSRGGYSRWLSLSCEKCRTPLFLYQKDGPGILKRLYLDRVAPTAPAGKSLACKKCETVLGVRVVYEKENRPAYRLFAGAVAKRVVKATGRDVDLKNPAPPRRAAWRKAKDAKLTVGG